MKEVVNSIADGNTVLSTQASKVSRPQHLGSWQLAFHSTRNCRLRPYAGLAVFHHTVQLPPAIKHAQPDAHVPDMFPGCHWQLFETLCLQHQGQSMTMPQPFIARPHAHRIQRIQQVPLSPIPPNPLHSTHSAPAAARATGAPCKLMMLSCLPARLYSRSSCTQQHNVGQVAAMFVRRHGSGGGGYKQRNQQASSISSLGSSNSTQRLHRSSIHFGCNLMLEVLLYQRCCRHTCLLVATATTLLPAATTRASSPAGRSTCHSFSPHHDSNARYSCVATPRATGKEL